MGYEFGESIYLGKTEEIRDFFQGKSNSLIVLGCGFDPRMNVGIKTLMPSLNEVKMLVIHYGRHNNAKSRANSKLGQKNLNELYAICENREIEEVTIDRYMSANEKVDISYYSLQNKITKNMIENISNIIVDISAMPKEVSFSLIKHIRRIKTEQQKIYILVCENSRYDNKIEEIPARDPANYMQCFNLFTAGREAVNDSTTVWIPFLGEHESAAFKKIAEFVKPDEICPVIPFPAKDISRGEKIIRSYGNYLFKELKIEKKNIMYAPENQPLLVYMKLCDTIMFYESALHYKNEEDIKYVFSSQSSKLMDVGILLTLLDLNKRGLVVTMAYVDNEGYDHPEPCDETYNQLSCICLDDKEFGW